MLFSNQILNFQTNLFLKHLQTVYKPLSKMDPEFQKKRLVSQKFVYKISGKSRIQCDTPLNVRGHGFLETKQIIQASGENNFLSNKKDNFCTSPKNGSNDPISG